MTNADFEWACYKAKAARAFRLIHEGAHQMFLRMKENKATEQEKAQYFKEFQERTFEKLNAAFDELGYGLAERCLATILLIHLHGAMVDTVEKDAEVQAVTGWYIPFGKVTKGRCDCDA